MTWVQHLPRDICGRIVGFVGPACAAEQAALRAVFGWRIRLRCARYLAHPAFPRHWHRLTTGRRSRLQHLDLWLNASDVRPDWSRLWRRFVAVNEVVVRINGAHADTVAWLWASMLCAPPITLTLILHRTEDAPAWTQGLPAAMHGVETFRLRFAGLPGENGGLRAIAAVVCGGGPVRHVDLAVPDVRMLLALPHTPVLSLRLSRCTAGGGRITIPADAGVRWPHVHNVRCREHLPLLLGRQLRGITVAIHDAACLENVADFRSIADGVRTVRVHFRVPHVDERVCRGFADVVLAGLAGHPDHTILLTTGTGKPDCVAWLAEVAREHTRRNHGARLVVA